MAERSQLIYKKSILFDPDKGFLELPVVRYALAILFGVCFILIVFVAATSRRSFQLDADGLSNFALLFRVPVGAFTLSLPVFALLAASHRSEQTKQQMVLTRSQIDRTDRQIKIASEQGAFSNYYKHLEEFVKYCEAHFKNKSFAVIAPRKLHALMYPRARQGDLNIDKNFLRTFDIDIDDLRSLLALLLEVQGRYEILHKISADTEELLEKYKIHRSSSSSGMQISVNGASVYVPGKHLSSFVLYHLQIIQTIDEALEFDANYVASSSVRYVFEFSKLLAKKGDIGLSSKFDFEELDKTARTSV